MDRVYRAEKSLCSPRKLKPYITTGHRSPRESLKSHLWKVAPINSKAGIPRTGQFFVSLTKETMPPLPWLTCATSFVGGFQRACQPMEAVPILPHLPYPGTARPRKIHHLVHDWSIQEWTIIRKPDWEICVPLFHRWPPQDRTSRLGQLNSFTHG